jgi:SAM-dependent methyltransferase
VDLIDRIMKEYTLDVSREISPNDNMFQGDRAHYFSVGESALRSIWLALAAAGEDAADIERILDLPCGHGRVLRVLRAAYPRAEITACDLDRDAVDFCKKTFGAVPVYSSIRPAELLPEARFHLIWCGSLFTHINDRMCLEFLAKFHEWLYPGGVLVLTVHGPSSAYAIRGGHISYGLDESGIHKLLAAYEDCGFGYADYPDTSGYGISVCSPFWVTSQIAELPDLRLLTYTEMGWDNHQDVIACIRETPEARIKRAL